MAPLSYYYVISVSVALSILLWFVSLVLVRKTGRTIFGQVYPVGTADYKSIVKKLANFRNIIITSIILLISFVNLGWSVALVARVNTPDSQALLFGAPIVILITGAFIVKKQRKEYRDSEHNKMKNKKSSSKHGEGGDSWLS